MVDAPPLGPLGAFGGEIAALAAAVFWAVAVALFRAPIAAHGARAINLAKNSLAAVLLGATMLALGQGSSLLSADARSLLLVAASGVVGLTFGDTALFSAVARIGPSRALLVQSFAPIFTAIMAYFWLGDRLVGGQWLGGLVILVGVAVVLVPGLRTASLSALADPRGDRPKGQSRGQLRGQRIGLALGLIAALGQAAGIVLAKEAMTTIPIVAASFVRMVAGGLGLVLVLVFAGRLRASCRVFLRRETVVRLLPASMLGTYLAFLLMMAGLAWTRAAVAAVLLSTVPVWSLLVDAAVERRWIRPAELFGTLIAVVGVAIVAMA
jgi:drug/metabolite transporter (DMT)-like permease